MLQREAKAYQHCEQLQYQVVPGVLAAGPAMDGTAYLLATCLLPVVGFSDCSSAKYQAMHAVKAFHALRLLHGDIRESNILCISEAKQSCKVILIDLGQSRLSLHTRVGLPARAAADSAAVYLGLSRLHRRHLGNVTW